MASTDGLDTLGIPRRTPRRRLVRAGLALLALVAVGAAVAFGIQRWRAPRGPRFTQAAVTRGELTASVVATGTLRATNTVQVGAEVSGRVARVLVEPNDVVHAGQRMVELDPAQLEATAREARASVAVANAAVRLARTTATDAQRQAARADALHERGLLPDAEWESARAGSERAEAEVQSAAARLEVARASLDRANAARDRVVIDCPIDGVVLTRNVEPGQAIAAQFQTPVLFDVAEDLSRMELHVDVDEADVGQVREGQRATFSVDAYPEQRFDAHIVHLRLAPRTVQGVVTYEAVLDVSNAERLLRPGMTATATIVTATHPAMLLVPNPALRFAPPREGPFAPRPRDMPTGPHVWILEGTTPRAVPVRVTATDGTRSAVTGEGIEVGVEVLTGTAREGAAS